MKQMKKWLVRFLSPRPATRETQGHSPLDGLILSPPASIFNWLSRMVMVLLGLFLLWACFAHLEEVAVAEGEVAPVERVQSIQHLEGGIIEEISAFEGDAVRKGQPLIKLNVSAFTANREELEITLQSLLLKKERLTREAAAESELVFSDELKDFRPELINTETQVFLGRRQELDSRLQLLKEQQSQRELDVQQLQTEHASVTRNLDLLRQKLKISNDLVKDKLTSQLDHLQLKGEVEELEGRLKIIDVSIPRAQAALAEAQERLRNEKLIFHNDALKELNDVEAEIARTREMMGRADDQVTRTTITSPIDGVIQSLKTRTIGGVVQPGEVIMEIVPTSANLLIEAKLNPRDIGFVKKEQDALVKFLTYDYARYGGLHGKVVSVSADSHTDRQSGETYFLVKIRTDRNYLGDEETGFPITTGMQATAEIHTGTKTVMQYMLKPVIKVTHESFRER